MRGCRRRSPGRCTRDGLSWCHRSNVPGRRRTKPSAGSLANVTRVEAQPELVIFDCDGVLVDSERLAVQVDLAVLTELGWPLSEGEIIERFMGRSHGHFVAEVEAHVGRRLPKGWDLGFEQRYLEAFEADLRAVEGIVEALEQIELPTCVASSGSHERIRFTLGLTGLWERFEGHIFSGDEVAEGKPAPDLFLLAAERMGAVPGGCVVVEDSLYGVRAACAAGMPVLGYAGGLTSADRLKKEGALVFDDMRALPGLLRGFE
jgi:HAD superfamily hydrolase (TIGR01509 family)